MEITGIYVCNQIYGGFSTSYPSDGVITKSLPLLSVVQSVHGSYDISIDDSPFQSTGEMGVFIAPRSVAQHIIHHTDKNDGIMTAQWLFLDAEINRQYRLDTLFSFPVLLPREYNNEIFTLLDSIGKISELPARLPYIDRIICILLEVGTRMEQLPDTAMKINNYIENNYVSDITADDIARELFCSKSSIYKYFYDYYGISPSNYINRIRMRHAQLLLDTSHMKVKEVAAAVGINDMYYFSKLFRKHTGISATEYRNK